MASKVYLLHYLGEIGDTTKPTGYAQHYLGSTSRSLKQRLAEHAAGRGAKITAAFARRISILSASEPRTAVEGWNVTSNAVTPTPVSVLCAIPTPVNTANRWEEPP